MSSWTKHECAWCGGAWQPPGFCETCKRDLELRPGTDDMTLDARIAELKSFHEGNGRFLMVPFGVLHARVETLMGRPVWTHEFANYDALIGELEGTQEWRGPVGSLIDIIGEDRADDAIVAVLP